MLGQIGNLISWAILASLIVACDSKPKHYFVLCEDLDGNGWQLVDFEKDKNGYLIACTYQSRDGKNWYTARCTRDGCG